MTNTPFVAKSAESRSILQTCSKDASKMSLVVMRWLDSRPRDDG